MARRIVIIQGHPDAAPERFCRAVASAYARGAEAAGHELRRIDVAALQLPPLQSRAEWQAEPDENVARAQAAIEWAQHIVVIYPLWLGDVPAALKAFIEQVLRPGFAFERAPDGSMGKPRLHGRSAHLIVSMGMPGFFYRWVYRAHTLKSLRRNVLMFCGIRPVRSTLLGLVESSPGRRQKWLAKVERDGRAGR
jgi:putative NADPH-quinone reductase